MIGFYQALLMKKHLNINDVVTVAASDFEAGNTL